MEPKNLPKAQTATPVVRKLNTSSGGFLVKNSIIVFVVFVLLGVASGFAIAKVKSTGGGATDSQSGSSIDGGDVKKGTVVGSDDTKTFKDTAEGVLKEGGIEGEGAYHLERRGGESQNVYLTSSVVDLSLFEGEKVKVWGKTFEGEKAGWLMDVGKVEVLE